ncbi:WD40 repeat domain-containing protein [Pilimelia columellifera]|uniref:WD40 repeat domain-containing protein n=1 Tax=Pilimelia columellifera subsp. columellifera TaxID=706583 RepID=A0ABN3MZC3_9ACTN
MRVINLGPEREGHAAPITHVAFRPDGRRLSTCSYDGTVIIWDTTDPKDPTRLATMRHRRLVNAAAWHPTDPRRLATASADKTVAVWRLDDEGPVPVTVLARHTDDVNAVAWLPDGRHLVCVSEDGRATMWDAGTGALCREIGAHAAHCMMVATSRQGLIATVGEDGLVVVTDPDAASTVASRRYDSSVEGCAWSPSGDLLAVARDDGAVDLLTAGCAHLVSISAADCAARSVAFADESTLVVGAYDGTLRTFDVAGRLLATFRDARVWPRSVATHGDIVAAGTFGATPMLLDRLSGVALAEPATATYGPNAVAGRGGELLIGLDSGTVLTLNLDSDPRRPDVGAHRLGDSPVLSVAAGRQQWYAGSYDGRVHAVTDTGARTSAQVGSPAPSMCLTADGLVVGTYDGDLLLLDPDTLAVRERLRRHGGSVKSLTATPGGFLSAATDRTVAGGDWRRRTTLWEHGNLVNAVAADRRGEVVATASRDHTVKVGRRDAAGKVTGPVLSLLGPDESVKCVAVLGDPGAPTVLAGSYDFGVYAWRVDWSQPAGALRGGDLVTQLDQAVSCMVRLDRDRAVVAGWDGQLVLLHAGADGGVRIGRRYRVADLLARIGQAPA